MKKILLGTTGLVGAAMLSSAASAETPKVTLGGFSDFQAGYVSDDKDSGQRSVGFRNDNEIIVKVDGKTNSGLGYGAQIDLEADITADSNNQGGNAARTFTYLEGSFGRVELGGNKSVAATQRVDASTIAVATGGINGSWVNFANGSVAGNRASSATGAATLGANFITTAKLAGEHGAFDVVGDESTYNATKISYYTPKFSGFQAGVSYTPQLNDRGQSVGASDVSGVADVIDAALSYNNTFSGGWKLAAAGTYEYGKGQGVAGAGRFGSDDINAWNAGATLGWQGFTVAGSYGRDSDSGIAGVRGSYYTAGLGYAAGPVGLSATYLNSETKQAGAKNKFDNIVLGADYKLAPGLTPYAEVSFYDFNGAANANDNQGTAVILGTQVAF